MTTSRRIAGFRLTIADATARQLPAIGSRKRGSIGRHGLVVGSERCWLIAFLTGGERFPMLKIGPNLRRRVGLQAGTRRLRNCGASVMIVKHERFG